MPAISIRIIAIVNALSVFLIPLYLIPIFVFHCDQEHLGVLELPSLLIYGPDWISPDDAYVKA